MPKGLLPPEFLVAESAKANHMSTPRHDEHPEKKKKKKKNPSESTHRHAKKKKRRDDTESLGEEDTASNTEDSYESDGFIVKKQKKKKPKKVIDVDSEEDEDSEEDSEEEEFEEVDNVKNLQDLLVEIGDSVNAVVSEHHTSLAKIVELEAQNATLKRKLSKMKRSHERKRENPQPQCRRDEEPIEIVEAIGIPIQSCLHAHGIQPPLSEQSGSSTPPPDE